MKPRSLFLLPQPGQFRIIAMQYPVKSEVTGITPALYVSEYAAARIVTVVTRGQHDVTLATINAAVAIALEYYRSDLFPIVRIL